MPRRVGLGVLVPSALLALNGTADSATGRHVQYCAQIPIVEGTPPWGFQTGAPITGATGR